MNLSTVTLSQLRYLIAVDDTRSFRLAAERSHVTQPALSMQVQKLEQALDVRVFDRSRQPVVPTRMGQLVLAQARRVLRETERMGQLVSEASGALSGSYRLGVIPTLTASLLPRFVPAFSRAHPEVELIIEELRTDHILERLAADTLDAGLASTPLHQPGLHERVLYREPLLAYLPSGHPLARRKTVRQQDLVDESVWLLAEGHCFGDQVLHLCKVHRPLRSKTEGRVDFRGGNFETLIGLVDAGLGLTVIPQLVASGLGARVRKARVRPFASPVPSREVALVHTREHLRAGITDALEREIASAVQQALPVSRARTNILDPRAGAPRRL